MKELNGHRYSFKEFDGYYYRVSMDILINGETQNISTDIYTDNNNALSTWDDLIELFITSGKCDVINAHQYRTKDEDEIGREFINQFFK